MRYYILWTHLESGRTGFRPSEENKESAMSFDCLEDAQSEAVSLTAKSQSYAYNAVAREGRVPVGPTFSIGV